MKPYPFIGALLLLASCGKTMSPPAPEENPAFSIQPVQFNVYADPRRRTNRPAEAQAGLRLAILYSKIGQSVPTIVWDTLLSARPVVEYPAPKQPMLIETAVPVQRETYGYYHITVHKIYRFSHQVVVDDHTCALANNTETFQLEIGL
jgi:hypothetical protein